ncbi:hypothetical protein PCANB_002176 [Pneumocystis canis]|nr:hypothetical protein PCANB_002176 [Pneumocystis canis]
MASCGLVLKSQHQARTALVISQSAKDRGAPSPFQHRTHTCSVYSFNRNTELSDHEVPMETDTILDSFGTTFKSMFM